MSVCMCTCTLGVLWGQLDSKGSGLCTREGTERGKDSVRNNFLR